jgi:hypothetical protein
MAYLRTMLGIGNSVFWQRLGSILWVRPQNGIVSEGVITYYFITEDGKYIVSE